MSGTEGAAFSGDTMAGASREDVLTELFISMIAQHANMAMMLMGQAPDSPGGRIQPDLEGARMFIDQLEAIEARTKGNLNSREQAVLKQVLMATRMSFVKAVESPVPSAPAPGGSPATSQPGETAGAPAVTTGDENAATPVDAGDDAKKKFTKKY
jgi:hypothetical protein